MSPSAQRAARWFVLVGAGLLVVGVLLQAYFIAVFILGGNTDALDIHTGLGNALFGIEVLVAVGAFIAYGTRWRFVGAAVALAVVGAIQVSTVEAGNEWVQGLHGLLALVVLILSHEVAQRAVRELGLGSFGK